jgi:malonyl CoA-acyl carrier protein transacylase
LATTILFPAFASEYSGNEGIVISQSENRFRSLLKIASDELETDLNRFDFEKNNFLDDELKSQFLSYIYSCSVAEILRDNKVIPSFVSGYSMGIYAALYYCKAISFTDGLRLIKYAWDTISGHTKDGKYGMGMIIGLNQTDIEGLLKNNKDIEICNQNNQHTFIISGLSQEIESVLELARNEGALKANLLPVSKPYHTHLLEKTSPKFSVLTNAVSFQSSEYKYVSTMDQNIVTSAEGLRNEVIENLWCRMNWLETMNKLVAMGTTIFFECGAGDSLSRNNRFVPGYHKSFPAVKIDRFLEAYKLD